MNAIHHFISADPWIGHIIEQRKLTELRPAHADLGKIQVGSVVTFRKAGDKAFCRITFVRRYDTYEEALINEGLINCMPGIRNLYNAIEECSVCPYNGPIDEKFGILAFGLELLRAAEDGKPSKKV